MTLLPNAVGAITMFVADRERAKAFYERVFDISPMFEDASAVAFPGGHIWKVAAKIPSFR
jgi:predicted enzyme related to lactoylglutathione lyase